MCPHDATKPASVPTGFAPLLLVELSEADSKKWLSLLSHSTTAEIADTRPCPAAPQVAKRRKQRQIRLTDEEKQKLVDAYIAGATTYQLAAQFGCHRNTVGNLLKSRGIALRCVSMSESQIDQAVILYESGLSLARVGDELGFDDATIRLRLIERGIRMRDSHGRYRTTSDSTRAERPPAP